MKTKVKISDIMDYPNKVLKEGDLKEIRYYFMKLNEIERFQRPKNRKNPAKFSTTE